MVCKKAINLLLCLLLCLPTITLAAAKEKVVPPVVASAVPEIRGEESITMSTRKRLAGVVFSGLGGAVLGLSTLSFYGRPQDHLQNIAIGFAVGIIAGTIFTTYRAVKSPYERYEYKASSLFTEEHEAFQLSQKRHSRQNSEFKPSLKMNWSF